MSERLINGVTPHPDLETLSAYVDGTLEDRARGEVEAHVAECEDCYELVSEVASATSDLPGSVPIPAPAPPRPVPPFYRRRRLMMVTGGLAVAAAILLAARVDSPFWRLTDIEQDRRFSDLIAAVGETRSIEARLDEFPYGAYRSNQRSGAASQNLSLLAAAGQLQSAARAAPTAANLHAWGIAELLIGQYDDAIRDLELAAAEETASARLLSDLAAAYLARAEQSDRPEDLPKALSAAQTALIQEPSLAAAVFNKGLAAAKMNLREEALKAWRRYLELDSMSPWADEVRRHIDMNKASALPTWRDDRETVLRFAATKDIDGVRRLARAHPQRVRELIEDELLPAVGANLVSRDSDTGLDALDTLVSAIVVDSGDRLLADALEEIVAVVSTSRPTEIKRLGAGLLVYGEGRRLYTDNRVGESAQLFQRASRALSGLNAMALWADHHAAINDYYKGSLGVASATQERLAHHARQRGYVALEARALWMLGLAEGVTGNHDTQLAHYQESLRLFEAIKEKENVGAVRNLLASSFLYLGDQRQTWRYTVTSLHAIDHETHPRRRHTQLASAANTAIRLQLPQAAIVIATETETAALKWGAPEAIIEASHYAARALSKIGRANDAVAFSLRAKALLPDVKDPSIRNRLSAEHHQTEAEVLLLTAPAQASEAAARALTFFRNGGPALRVPRLHLAKARALRNLDGEAAREEYSHAIARFEDERASLPAKSSIRISHFDEVWDAYGELLHLLAGHGADPVALFRVAERGRARSLHERLGADVLNDVNAVQSVLPAAVTLVYFAVLEQSTLAWVINREEMRLVPLPVGATTLSKAAAKLDGLMRVNPHNEAWRRIAGSAFDALIAPLHLRAAETASLIIVPDGPLHNLPFGALWDDQRQQYLAEAFELSLAPSAGFIVRMAARRHVIDARSSIAAFAFGAGDPVASLPTLPEVDVEVSAAAARFVNATVIAGAQATPQRFARAVQQADVIHFAGHAVANREFPERSTLRLSDGAGGSRSITAGEIEAVANAKVQLAVLSACGALDGPISGGEGAVNLARSLIAAGASWVVAARSDVDDRQARRIITWFYEHLAAGKGPVRSLALAIRAAIQAKDFLPVDWSQWAVVGIPMTEV